MLCRERKEAEARQQSTVQDTSGAEQAVNEDAKRLQALERDLQNIEAQVAKKLEEYTAIRDKGKAKADEVEKLRWPLAPPTPCVRVQCAHVCARAHTLGCMHHV